MDNAQMITIIASILIPMLTGFAWIIHQIGDLKAKVAVIETRLSIVETILAMMGAPIKSKKISNVDE